MPHFLYSMTYSFGDPEHPMTFQRENFKNAMCNSQKEAPTPDGHKKTTQDSADYYDGSSAPKMSEKDFGF